MRVDVLTLFPDAFAGPLDVSILKRAREAGLFSLHLHNIRDHAPGPHHSVDDYPFGGGQGMVLRVDVLDRAWQAVSELDAAPPHTIYMSPAGQRLDDRLVRELAAYPRLAIVCGRYEGVDERFIQRRVDREVSVGDFIVTGGELPAMVLIDAVVRHLPGALGDAESPEDESFADGLLEHPQYTRPAEYEGLAVPPPLLGGSHAAIEAWKAEQRLARTATRRPDLLPSIDPANEPDVRIPNIGRIRDLRWPADYPSVRALWESTGITLGQSDTPAELAKLIARNPGLALVAEAGKAKPELLGTVLAGWDGRTGTFYRLAVASAHQGRGIEAALLAEIETRLRQRGCRRVNLDVEAGDRDATAVVAARGWQQLTTTAWARAIS